jgi:hypothetical protein
MGGYRGFCAHATAVVRTGLEAIISRPRFDEISEIKRLDPLELYP